MGCRNYSIDDVMMKRSLVDITLVPYSHKVGLKRVLLAAEESGCAITQIAITDLKAGEKAETHVHEDMMEGFYVLYGCLDIKLYNEIVNCKAGDFVWVKSGMSHELHAKTDVRMMTIGCLAEIRK